MYLYTADHPAGPRRRVLLVELPLAITVSLRLSLLNLGHEVLVAPGSAAAALARSWQPDVILSGVGLPDPAGFTAAETLWPPGVVPFLVRGGTALCFDAQGQVVRRPAAECPLPAGYAGLV
jgi:hypothetical protein